MRSISYIIALYLLLFSCEQQIHEPYELFVIPEGKHDDGWKLQSLQSRTLNFSAIFNESAIYETATEENQHDINKLLGFSDCNTFHHNNSARFGWRWLDGNLEVHAYAYVQGERISEYLGNILLNESYEYQLQITDSHYVFYLQGYTPVKISRSSSCNRGVYYMLFPYFGGDETAPHDISIQILTKY